MNQNEGIKPNIHFVQITAENVLEICQLSETLTQDQRQAVADNAISIAQGHCSENAWMRAIYDGQTPVGFTMLHIGSDWEDGIDCPGIFLWRLMVAKPHQGRGVGKEAIELLVAHLRSLGIPEIYTSYHLGPGSPKLFCDSVGFTPTGSYYGDEPEVVLKIVP
jgi:diamine N-acetyltransferase